MIDLSFLDELEKFDLIVKRKVTTKYSGERKSSAIGRGTVMSDHRMYTPGDDFRAIDWNIYARTDDLHIKRYDEEKSLVVHAIIDSSKSMGYGAVKTKFDYASLLGIGFCYLAVKNNEKFRVSTFGDDLTMFPSNRGFKHLGTMVDHLNGINLSGSSNFATSMQRYKGSIGSRSFIVIISDYLFDIEEFKTGLAQFAHQDIYVIQVLDPTEIKFDLDGNYYLKDSESGQVLRTAVTTRMKNHYQEKLKVHNEELSDACRGLKAKFFTVSTDTPIFDVFWRVLH